jgi:ankyrin repeat protein
MSHHDHPTDLRPLKREAKRLRKAFADGDPGARVRVRAHLPDTVELRHADALHVVAREHGYASWPRLKLAVEQLGLDRATRARTLMRALHYGQAWIVETLLDADPGLPDADPALPIALFDDAAVLPWLEGDPARATRPLGRRTPLLHLAFSRHLAAAPDREGAMLRIAGRLLDLGADPNDGYAPDPRAGYRLSALYGALGHADNLPLARLLLARGADPNDGESLYHATELPHADGLRLLLAHGARPAGTNALLHAVDLHDATKVRLLLEAGADPDETVVQHGDGVPSHGIAALQHAARRGAPAAVVDALLEAGADPDRHWAGHAPYATARIHGSDAAAQALAARGLATRLTPIEAALAACAEGRAPATPLDPAVLSDEDRRLPARVAAVPGRVEHLRALLDAGLDPDVVDEMGLTPLHVALWEGLPEHVETLLAWRPDLTHVNAHGGDALGTLIHGAEFCPVPGRDHLACARQLFAAGVREPTDAEIDACGDEAMADLLRDRRATG